MATFYHGTSARFYYGHLDFSSYAEQVEQQLSRSVAEYRPLNETGVRRVAGYRDVSITLTGGPLEDENDEYAWTRLNEDTQRIWAFMPAGDVFGHYAYCGQALGDNQQRNAGDDVIRLPVALVSAADVDCCIILRPLGAGGTSPGATHTGTAASSNGGAAYLVCTGVTSALSVTVQHSTNGTSWTDLLTMTTMNVPGSEVKTVTGTVNKYLRVSWTGLGTWFLAFGRR